MADDPPSEGRTALDRLRQLIASGPMPMHPEPDEVLGTRPVVEQYTAEQDLGPYPICIVGVPGAYTVDAMDRDPLGPFVTLDEARQAMRLLYGEFITSGPA